MRPLYEQLKRQHYSSNQIRDGYASAEQLFSEIGYDFSAVIKQQPAYENTCAAGRDPTFKMNFPDVE